MWACSSDKEKADTAKVSMYKGKPTLFINDSAYLPMQYALTHAYGARWSWEEVPFRQLENFGKAGIDLFQVDLYLEDIWYKGKSKLDIIKAQKQVRGVLDAHAKAKIVVRLHVNSPFWWNEENKDECTHYANGETDDRPYGAPYNNEDGDVDRPLRASLASEKWKQESGAMTEMFCKEFANTPEGKKTIGIHVCGGIYGEWHYWGFIDNDPDTGPAMTKYFKKWLQKKYSNDKALQLAWKNDTMTFKTASIPDTTLRKNNLHGIFRDPEQEMWTIDYFTCQQEVVADDIEYFCKIVKENWPRNLIVGVFYGYFHMTFCRQASGGHLCIEQISNSPYIDYISAPQSYYQPSRDLGGSGNSRGIIESAMINGKLWLDEMDNGYMQKIMFDGLQTRGIMMPDPDYVPVLRRNAIFPLMRGAGFWYYDFGPRNSRGWWDIPQYMENIAEEKKFMDEYLNKPFESAADVLVVWDQESFYYVKNSWYPLCYDQLDAAAEEIRKCGAVSDHIYLFDLKKINMEQYKAIIFMNCHKIDSSMKILIKEKVAQNNRTLIWNYLPGYTDGKKLDIEFVKSITGININFIPYKKIPEMEIKQPAYKHKWEGEVFPMAIITDKETEALGYLSGTENVLLAKKIFSQYTSIHSTLPLHGREVFMKLLDQAGCHIYNSTDDFTYANKQLILIHSAKGGERDIKLKNGKNISIKIPAKSTTIIDANSGDVLLE